MSEKELRVDKKTLEKLVSKYNEIRVLLTGRYYYLSGLGLGVTLGIMGNLLASHWVEVLRGIVPNEWWWKTNVIASVLAFTSMLAFIIWIIRLRQETLGQFEAIESTLIELQAKAIKERQNESETHR